MSYFCKKCGEFEELFKTFEEVEVRKDKVKCPLCGKKAVKEEFNIPARFSGCFGDVWNTSPSKRHSFKKADKKGNKGSAA